MVNEGGLWEVDPTATPLAATPLAQPLNAIANVLCDDSEY